MGTLTFRGYPLLYRKALAKHINARGGVGDEQVRALAAELAGRLPPA